MANNRSGIAHPALNTAGGASLWDSIDTIYQTLSDNDVGRWVSFSALANGATLTLTHGFGCPFDDVRVIVYTGTYPNLAQNQSFVSAANATHATTKVDITAPASGGPFSGYVLLVHGAGGSGGGTTVTVSQTAHGFDVGDVLYLNGSTYAKAKADAANTAEVVGVVSKVNGANGFELTMSGLIKNLSGLVAGEVYFLSPSTAGSLTLTEPTVVGQVSLPVAVAASSTSLFVAPKRGAVVGSSNARTQIALSGGISGGPFTTTVQNIADYDAGELTGWVSITAGTPLRFYVAAQFSKNGAANNYNVSYQVSGDTPPQGFVITATAAGLLQVTLPSIAGFASASINFSLNAPAIGTSFPLTIQGSLVTSATTTEPGVITLKRPTQTIYTSGSGTYNVPSGALYLKVRMVGGGAGGTGGSTGTNAGNGGTGGNTTFGSSLLTANGGTSGGYVYRGPGGSGTINAPAIGFVMSGGAGGPGGTGVIAPIAGSGGNSALGGGGGGGVSSNAPTAGQANTGGGGGGGSSSQSSNAGGGGGGGGYIEAIINAPSSTYAYSVGAAGTAGAAGTSGIAGAAGGSGVIIIDEFYY